jgi:hypothetical protein
VTPNLTPYRAVTLGFRRTNSLRGRPTLNIGRLSTLVDERIGGELENRKGPQVGRCKAGPPGSLPDYG